MIKKLRDGRGPAILFINGFLNGNNVDFDDWERGVKKKFPNNPLYGVTWESQTLIGLSIRIAGLAALPKFSLISNLFFDDPWHDAVNKSLQTGVLLADLFSRKEKPKNFLIGLIKLIRLISRFGKRDEFILMGHSLGAGVIYNTLKALLTKKEKYIRDVYLFGGAVGNDAENWENVQRAVTGKIYNFYSANDSVLSWFYKPVNLFMSSPIGLGKICLEKKSKKLVNVNVTEKVGGHNEYKAKLEACLDSLAQLKSKRLQARRRLQSLIRRGG
ncbi:MAG: DUF726 domain-containing protein [Synergistaceae bacterium]|jgi:hypothetical protein|nr:DUF726 domain-containing protein [Synergistaceae bacterium]